MKIGFVGLGKMGLPMAKRLLAAGYDLIVYDTNAEPIAKMQKHKAEVADSLDSLAQSATHIILMLPNSQVVQSVIKDSYGLLCSLTRLSPFRGCFSAKSQ